MLLISEYNYYLFSYGYKKVCNVTLRAIRERYLLQKYHFYYCLLPILYTVPTILWGVDRKNAMGIFSDGKNAIVYEGMQKCN